MQTLNNLFSAFKLNRQAIQQLSREAKEVAVGCGRSGVDKKLSSATWDLFDDLSDKVWYASLSNAQKISLGFQLFELFPSYYHFLVPFYHAIRNKEIADADEKDFTWKKFMQYYTSENYYADPVGYVLWVNFFEDEETVRETWQGLMKHCHDRKALLRLLEQSGPVPFDLKEVQYNSLVYDKTTHDSIFTSLLNSSFDVFGKTDSVKALQLLGRLQTDRKAEHYRLLKERLEGGKMK